jgi:hypothetical protein
LREDAEAIERQLLDDFFAENDIDLANIKIEILEPSSPRWRMAA